MLAACKASRDELQAEVGQARDARIKDLEFHDKEIEAKNKSIIFDKSIKFDNI